MTNRDLLIASLKDELDDWAASESNIAYNIACPYYGADMRAEADVVGDMPTIIPAEGAEA